jgi:hypothetical protein
VINQLRLYRLNPDLKDVFLVRFRDHAARIMRERYGFRIVAMWLSDKQDDLRFVYILSWPDLLTKEDAWRRFMADEEWSEIKRVTRETSGEPVQGIEDILLNAVDFSAPLGVQS